MTTVVLSGGPLDPERVARVVAGLSPTMVVAADSGLHAARAAGLAVDVVVGDMDSVDPGALVDAVAAGAAEVRHPVDKDATDLELALDLVLALGDDAPGGVTVIGSPAGRMDHLLGWAALVGSPRYAPLGIEAHLGDARLVPVHGRRVVPGRIGEVVSLMALGGPATGVRTEGLRWALRDGTLHPGSTLGLSNRFTASVAEVSVGSGTVLVVVPGPETATEGNP